MNKSKYSKEQIISYLRKYELGVSVQKICREGGFSDTTFYKWKAKYSVPSGSKMLCSCDLGAENALLKKLLGEARSDIEILKETLGVDRLTSDQKRRSIMAILNRTPGGEDLNEGCLMELLSDL